jgi:hypothetical protein
VRGDPLVIGGNEDAIDALNSGSDPPYTLEEGCAGDRGHRLTWEP